MLNPPAFDRYIPGKLYDYLAMRRPVLVHGQGGEVQRSVDFHRAGRVIARDDPQALEAALSAVARGEMELPATADEWLAAHTRETLAQRTWAFINNVLETHRAR